MERGIQVAREAGVIIKAAYEAKTHTIATKEHASDLVTQTDKQVEQLCVSRLQEYFPTQGFIGEETEETRSDLEDRPTWIIDPVDGTTNFCHGFPFVCVSIGLCINKQPVVGIVFNPVIDRLYSAAEGLGAFLHSHESTRLPLNPLELPSGLSTALVATEYGTAREELVVDAKLKTVRVLVTQPVASHGIRSCGSAALSMCLVAEGGVDVYYEAGVHAWDVCAGVVIVREAGGLVTNAHSQGMNVMARSCVCVRGVKGFNRTGQKALMEEIQSLMIPIDYEFD